VLSSNRIIQGLSAIPDMLRHSFMAARCLQQIKDRHGLDIIEFPDWRAAGLFCTRGSHRLAPTICRVHGYLKLMRRIHSAKENPNIQCLQWLEGMALSGADLIAPNTRWIAGQLERDYNVPVSTQYVHYMGIDATRFDLLRTQSKRSEIRKSLEIPEASSVILSCGRLEKRKGYEYLIHAVAALRRRGVESYLVIAGRDVGTEQARLLKIAEECGVSPYLKLAGYVSYDDLPHWYAMCDVYAGASCGESPGLTYQEAMACGRPVVAFRDGAIPEVVRHGETGFLVSPITNSDDDEAMTEMVASLQILLTNAELRNGYGAAAKDRVRNQFSLEAVIPRHLEMYSVAMERRPVRDKGTWRRAKSLG
jgi:glycosyltransferase involved in cell wall biosynthesis